ncbi:MAG: hypothetical protein IKC22_06855 [Bacilli bacterium]|nr:hypothetical protein [Bacilli bacterium]
MVIRDGNYCYDFFPILFIVLGTIGFIFNIIALIKSFKMKNNLKYIVMGFGNFVILLYLGAIVLGLIGFGPRDCWGYFWRSASSWVSFGLSCGTLLFGIVNFILYTKTKYRVPNKKDKEDEIQGIVTNNTAIAKQQLNQNDVLFYVKYSQGAISVTEDYITIYKNLLNFSNFTKGRVSKVIFINDIQSVEYKGCGWFRGILGFTFKHPNKPVRVRFGKWFVSRRKRFNKKMTPVYQYILSKVIENNK